MMITDSDNSGVSIPFHTELFTLLLTGIPRLYSSGWGAVSR